MFSDRLALKYSTVMDEDGRTNIQRIHKAAERMQNLITDILTFSKISVDTPAFVDCDMNALLREMEATPTRNVSGRGRLFSCASRGATGTNWPRHP